MVTRFAMFLCVLVLGPVGNSAYATASEPAVAQVQTLSSALLAAMKAGPRASMMERYRQLKPVVEQTFALPFMTRLSVGPDWAKFSPQQQKALVAAFSRYTIANYAHNFHDFNGQRFDVDANVITRGPDKVVRTSITSTDGTATNLLYRMRDVDGAWKIVDVFFNGVSQLTLHRVDFTSAIGSGGAPALIAYLNKLSDGLMK
ncbi:MAG TPA: ABC transporter substrate-binding protein [Ktedonobacteraceae bacterium]|nr:ABC transporter substrate-binding protein [Steroidobacteraceae bacterium]HEV2579356.1 ABC transporter substrate-binding protein [Ktedonobacteraceae bacterium]